MKKFSLFATSVLLVLACSARAEVASHYPLPQVGDDLVGENHTTTSTYEDTLVDIAARHQLGFNLMRSANPDVDPWLPGDGTPVLLPRLTILPNTDRLGIVINVAEMRLYHYHTDRDTGQPAVNVYAISVGRGEWSTPVTTTRVTGRVKDPVWYPPASIRAEHAARGDILPGKVPAGPDNPLGEYLLSLGIPSYFIHGTNRRFGIGMQVTHGCIRMYPENIEQLVNMAPNNTPVTIVNQPFKTGWRGDDLYLEVHRPLESNAVTAELKTTDVIYALVEATKNVPDTHIDWRLIDRVIAEANGVPQQVGNKAVTTASSS